MVVIRSKSELDECPRIGHRLILPAIIGLEAAQSVFRWRIPLSRSLSVQIMPLNQSLLDLMSAFRIDLLLPANFLGVFSLF